MLLEGLPWWLSGKEFHPCTTTTELVLESPRATTTEARTPRAWAQQREATVMRCHIRQLERSPRWPQPEKSPCSSEDPAQS